jgi:hypothetical protein
MAICGSISMLEPSCSYYTHALVVDFSMVPKLKPHCTRSRGGSNGHHGDLISRQSTDAGECR